jgi:hypothetical protein
MPALTALEAENMFFNFEATLKLELRDATQVCHSIWVQADHMPRDRLLYICMVVEDTLFPARLVCRPSSHPKSDGCVHENSPLQKRQELDSAFSDGKPGQPDQTSTILEFSDANLETTGPSIHYYQMHQMKKRLRWNNFLK